jgi:hypothetical protein
MLGEEQANQQSAGKSVEDPHELHFNLDVVRHGYPGLRVGRVRKGVLEVESERLRLRTEQKDGLQTCPQRGIWRSFTFSQGVGCFARWDPYP